MIPHLEILLLVNFSCMLLIEHTSLLYWEKGPAAHGIGPHVPVQ